MHEFTHSCTYYDLLKEIPQGTTVIMDNAAFHKPKRTKELIEEAG
jgi:hypothetical protein